LIINRRFDISLPVSLLSPFKNKISNKEETPAGQTSNNIQKQGGGTPREGNKQETPVLGVTNPKPRADWTLKENESFQKVFIGKSKPKWEAGDCRWCAKYHT
jgi:hypothetical protein